MVVSIYTVACIQLARSHHIRDESHAVCSTVVYRRQHEGTNQAYRQYSSQSCIRVLMLC